MSVVAPSVSALLAALKPGQRYTHPTPPGSGDAWLLTELAAAAGKPIVVLTAEPLEAQRLAEEIPIFSSKLRVRPLPDWETLP
jgi:transcription-repair coupling factor (superfamily II helicase)